MKKKRPDTGYQQELEEIRKKLELFERHLKEEALGKEEGDIRWLKNHITQMIETHQEYQTRFEETEFQVNLLTRLVTTLCLENFGFRLSQFRKLIRKIEKEAEEDSEIAHLESLYALEPKVPSHAKHDKNPKQPNKNHNGNSKQ
jgi:hypothetical protein